MSVSKHPNGFHSAFAPHLNGFLTEKHTTGFHYREGEIYLRLFDRLLTQEAVAGDELPRSVVEQWMAKRLHEGGKTHSARISIVRHFAHYLTRQGIPAYLPPPGIGLFPKTTFIPRIFTHQEIIRIFCELDHMRRFTGFPLRHLVMPELFRTLYACGLRVGEAVALQVRDVDLDQGILTLRKTKGDRQRLVPLAPGLHERLRHYAERLGQRPPDAPFFPESDGGHLHRGSVYALFKHILRTMKIPHVGGHHGPRVHDLRHTFAVHRLLQWYREGADLNTMLPLLSTYLGHAGMEGTQRYLRLIPELLPEVTGRMEATFGQVVPGGQP